MRIRRISIGLVLCCIGGSIWPTAAAESLSIATFQADVTPPIGSPLCHGNITPVRKIADPLNARGIILLGAGRPIVLCAVDWTGIGNGGQTVWCQALAEAAGTTPDRIAVHTVHQHDAPGCDFSLEDLVAEYGLEGRVFNVPFAREAVARTAAAVRRSLASPRKITHVGTGEANVERVASTRRVLGPDGKVQYVRYATCTKPAVAAAPEGLVDPSLRQVSFWNENRPVAVLTYYACHPVTVYGRGAVSADIAGLARGLRDFFVPDALHVYFAGPGGDLAPGKYNDGRPQRRFELAGRLADAMDRAWTAVVKQPITAADVDWRVRPTCLPVRDGLTEDGLLEILSNPSAKYVDRVRAARNLVWLRRSRDRGVTINFTCLHIGPARIVHLPGEPFVSYQLAAKKMQPEAFVCVAGYGEYGPGYIPTADAYDQGGYEVTVVSRVGPGAEPAILSAIRELLK